MNEKKYNFMTRVLLKKKGNFKRKSESYMGNLKLKMKSIDRKNGDLLT
jgi:hypothetical protein